MTQKFHSWVYIRKRNKNTYLKRPAPNVHSSIIYNCQDMEATSMPIDRRMDKDVVHIYNGVLLSHKKERNWVICRDVDGSRDCHTE